MEILKHCGIYRNECPSRDFRKQKCSENMQHIYKRTPMWKCSPHLCIVWIKNLIVSVEMSNDVSWINYKFLTQRDLLAKFSKPPTDYKSRTEETKSAKYDSSSKWVTFVCTGAIDNFLIWRWCQGIFCTQQSFMQLHPKRFTVVKEFSVEDDGSCTIHH